MDIIERERERERDGHNRERERGRKSIRNKLMYREENKLMG